MRATKLVKHVGFDHPVRINVEDFDPEIHAELDTDKPAAKKAAAKKAAG